MAIYFWRSFAYYKIHKAGRVREVVPGGFRRKTVFSPDFWMYSRSRPWDVRHKLVVKV